MSAELWTRSTTTSTSTLIEDDPALAAALAASAAAGLPPIAVSPAQGKLLSLLVRVHGASSILELGTLGGYSTIWLARALPDGGRLMTLELDPGYAAVASANIERAGLARTRRGARGRGTRVDGRADRGGRGAVRHGVHRRRQGEHAGVLRAGAGADAARGA